MLKYDDIRHLDDEYVMRTYKRMPALFVQGSGCNLWDNRGNEYLDMLAGIAVCVLGHCHPSIVSAITRQSQQLMHVSNLMLTAPQALLAKRLCEIGGMDRVWYGQCGATANEAAIKLAKKHGNSKRPSGDYEIVALQKGFHGRTLGALSATGQRKYQRSFEPIVPGFVHVPPNDMAALKDAVGHQTAAIMVEPIMGEGGVQILDPSYLELARKLCDEFGALLIFDEVQCGMGRTGKWFAFQHSGVVPDVLVLAKGLGGGFPIGAMLARGKAADVLEPGDQGSTFGGNPLGCSVALAVIDTIDHQDLLQNAASIGKYLKGELEKFGPIVEEVTGAGLMLGIRLSKPIAKDVVTRAFEKKLIINATSDDMLRLLPPLILTEAQAERALDIIAECLKVKRTPAVSTRVISDRPQPLHDVLAIDDLSDGQLIQCLELASHLKQQRHSSSAFVPQVDNRSVALVFEKASLRTRVSFETAIRELGGQPIYLTRADIGMGDREAVKDIASNLSGWVSVIVARMFWQRELCELAEFATVPVVNALTEMEHPCQALADMQTIREEFGVEKVKITYVGDGNNVSRSLAKIATRLGYPITLCGPSNFQLEPIPGLIQTASLEEGLADAKVVYTDVWVSMGDEHEQEHRSKVFAAYQVDSKVMSLASPDSIFMHCLPARRGIEVTDEVMDGINSRIVPQAENRLHAQKALLKMVMGW